MSSMKVTFCESVQPSIDAINKRIDSIGTTNNNGYGKRSLVTSDSAYPPAKRLRSPQQFSVPSACDQLENVSETASTISTTMGNMFCSPKTSASTMNDSEGSASSADEQPKDFIQGFTISLENKSSGLSPSEFISKAWFEAKGYDMPDGWTSLHYDKARSRYIKHTNAYAFNAQNINDVFKLSGPAASDMKNLSKQQTDIQWGCSSCSSCFGGTA